MVAMTSAYMAVRNTDQEGLYGRMAVMEADREVLDVSVRMAYEQLRHIFLPYILQQESSELPRSHTLWVRPGLAVGEGTVSYWRALAYEFLKTMVLADWLRIVAPSCADLWQSQCEEVRQRLIVSLTSRVRKPQKRMEVI